MIKIGEFSRLARVTVKSLHHYEQLGLLLPVHINKSNGYRFYSVEQLPQIHRILALKEIGLSLEQIGAMAEDKIDIQEIRGMLILKKAETRQLVREQESRLAKIEYRLRMLEAEEDPPVMDVVIKPLDPLLVLAIPHHEVTEMSSTVKQIKQAIISGEIKFTGVSLDVVHGDEYSLDSFDNPFRSEAMIVVDEDQPGDVTLKKIGVLKLRDEPGAVKAATLMLHGLKDRVKRVEKISLLYRWAIEQGFQLESRLRLVHHIGPLQSSDRSEWITEPQLVIGEKRGHV